MKNQIIVIQRFTTENNNSITIAKEVVNGTSLIEAYVVEWEILGNKDAYRQEFTDSVKFIASIEGRKLEDVALEMAMDIFSMKIEFVEDCEKEIAKEKFVSRENRALEVGMLVGVHWNSHIDKYSVVAMKSRNTVGLVVGYVDNIELSNVTFKIEKSVQKKVRETGTKDRHAYVVGIVENFGVVSLGETKNCKKNLCMNVKYNPFKFDTFSLDLKNEHLELVDVESVFMSSIDNKPTVKFSDDCIFGVKNFSIDL